MKSEQNDIVTNEALEDTSKNIIETEYVDEFGNPIDPSLIDEFGNFIGAKTEYVDEFGNPIDPSLIDEFGNFIGNTDSSLDLNINQPTENETLIEGNNVVSSASEHQMDNKELMQGMVTFDYNNVPITDIVNSIILDAINKGASDIHFDPFDEGIKIRIRIDGQLNDYSIVPLFVKKNMITRIKIISGMNITESRVPQDGAIRTELASKTIDLRVSCLPTNMGEKIVIRIMDYSMSAAGVEALDFNEKNLEKVKKMLELPNGIILVTGATGSGKSTTVYSMLQKLNVEGTNLITVEDPIEMNIGGINQVQAVSEIGLTFATVLRSILRQDPDVIMIGEIRDDETARIAVRASITGHLVLSTIHTNNSLNTIERLTDMSVERYLLGTALSGVVSQKLARRLCEKCKKIRKTNDYEKEIFKKALNKDIDEIYEPVGCPHCSRGYRGRIAIQEVLLLNQAIQDAITKGVDKTILRKLVYGENGTETMLQDGLQKVLEGKTSFDEIIKLIDLEDDLGTGTQLGLTEQIEASRMEAINTQTVNTGNSPININITKELIDSLTNLGNLASLPNNTPIENTEKKDIDDTPAVTIESKNIETPTVEDSEEYEIIQQTEENETNLNDSQTEVIDKLDNTNDIIILDDEDKINHSQTSEKDLITYFKDNLNQANKKKFVLNTKKIIHEISRNNFNSDELNDIVKKYIYTIRNSNSINLEEKNNLLELFNQTFGTNESMINLPEEQEKDVKNNIITENILDISESEIDDILGTSENELVDILDENAEESIEIQEDILPPEQIIKEVNIHNEPNDMEIEIINSDFEEEDIVKTQNDINLDDVDFSTIDDALVESMISNLSNVKEDD